MSLTEDDIRFLAELGETVLPREKGEKSGYRHPIKAIGRIGGKIPYAIFDGGGRNITTLGVGTIPNDALGGTSVSRVHARRAREEG